MTPQTTRRTPRATDAIRTVRIARTLAALAPEVAGIRLTPVWTDRGGVPRRRTHVLLLDGHGRPFNAPLAAHRIARDLLHQQFSRADWNRSHRYEVRTGRLSPMATSFGPRELGRHEGDAR
ncbi:hypothetical protein ACGH2B_12365 [Streptomyces sp. BBFR2]|uniref:hypothetical protein n=1 Tax=Streptomyces sp. BBFR2 TaxID=3372854 RepID=UPI0037DA55CB